MGCYQDLAGFRSKWTTTNKNPNSHLLSLYFKMHDQIWFPERWNVFRCVQYLTQRQRFMPSGRQHCPEIKRCFCKVSKHKVNHLQQYLLDMIYFMYSCVSQILAKVQFCSNFPCLTPKFWFMNKQTEANFGLLIYMSIRKTRNKQNLKQRGTSQIAICLSLVLIENST